MSEFKAASAVSSETATEITATVANTHRLGASLGAVTVQTALPATYTAREAHEWEAYAPTDTVITDTYQYETDGELGVASGDKPLVQPTEICSSDNTPDDTSCIAAAEKDVVDHGYFLGDGTNTFFTSSSTHYNPSKSGNSAIPLPYMDASTSVRVRAHVTAAPGHALILGFWPDLSSTAATRAGKWYLQPERAVLGTPGSSTTQGTPDLGTDVVSFEDTRATNAAPAPSNINSDGTSNIRVATFNVENFFTETGEAFAAANPAIGNSAAGVTSSTTKGCQYDYDRNGTRTLTYQCVSPYAQPTAWDAISGAVTAYKAGVTNGPRGAATQADLDRQTAKIVTAINGLGGIDPNAVNHGAGADIVSLEEIENPNKLKEGVTNSPLAPNLSNLKDQGQGTPIANRDAALAYLVDKLNAAAGSDVWAYVKSPEESTDATSMVHLCSILRGDGVTPVDGNAASLANAACSYSSGADVIRTAFIYKKATIVPVGPSDIDYPANPLSPDNPGNNAQATYNGASPFDLAREPLAQFFKPVGYPDSDGFAVIVNHFKSKGGTTTSDDPGITVTGDNKSDPLVGAYNAARTAEAIELVRFANQFAAQWHTDKVLMVGDFNSYTDEDPIGAVLDASKTDPDNGVGALDFSLIESSDPNDITYNFTSNVNVGLDASGTLKVATPNTAGTTGTDQVGYGTVGSIDHEFISEGFKSMLTGADVWEINANETDAYDYGRYNSNATNFYYGLSQGSGIPSDVSYATDLANATPFRSSDHKPDDHGPRHPGARRPECGEGHRRPDPRRERLPRSPRRGLDGRRRRGARRRDRRAPRAVRRVEHDRDDGRRQRRRLDVRVVHRAGQALPRRDGDDRIDVSAAGDHEFDKGWQDLTNRLMKPYDATTNPYGPVSTPADPDGIPYLAANVVYTTDPDGAGPLEAGDPIAPPTKEFTIPNRLNPDEPIRVGFIGVVTTDLASLESPANLAGVTTETEPQTIATINHYADLLKAGGDDLVVLLTHAGAPSIDCSSILSDTGAFAQEMNGIDDNVDAVLSAHTHLEYSCAVPVAGWADKSITTRPIIQAGSYAVALDQVVYSFDADAHAVSYTSNLVGVKGPASALFSAPEDPAVAVVVANAVSASQVVGDQVLGQLAGPFDRSRLSDGEENRGGESTLGNQVAEIQRWATSDDSPAYAATGQPSAQIAFMNPGGLRSDMEGTNPDGSGNLTYRSAANVQPFGNELVTESLTGAQIKTVLEEQWSRDNIDVAHSNIPSRPFLKLGISKGFTYTYHEVPDPYHAGATLGVIDGMWLNGSPISLTQSYVVTINSFLATGGDNFWELAYSGNPQSGQTDLNAQVQYMAQFGSTPLEVDYSQRAVEVTFPNGAPTVYAPGDHVVFDLSSLDMAGPTDVKDTTLAVKLGATTLGTVTVTHASSAQPYDIRGTAHVDVVLPGDVVGGITLTVTGATTGTTVLVPLTTPTPVIASATPTISGDPHVGETLTADAGAWGPSGVALSYQWFRAGAKVVGATDAQYTLTDADYKKNLTVRVTGAFTGLIPVTTVSAAVAVVPGTIVPGTATIATPGDLVEGAVLTAQASSTPTLGVTASYQWYRAGTAIDGATSQTYTVTAADVKKNLVVKVTLRRLDFTSATAASNAVQAGIGTITTATPLISGAVSGTATVGSTLTASAPGWTAGLESLGLLTLHYQWYRAGTAIDGATDAVHVVTADDLKKNVMVRVSATAVGYKASASIASGAVAISAGSFGSITAAIVGTGAGTVLTVGGIPETLPVGTIVSYEWRKSGVAIPGRDRRDLHAERGLHRQARDRRRPLPGAGVHEPRHHEQHDHGHDRQRELAVEAGRAGLRLELGPSQRPVR